ncbi:hypothetical protein BDU57DRAFT_528795 [Ampelomyces quisqualis]|uniref:DUF4604 domain-containing protein n=1 Tax=Ampelomyces quisqualis TaxID=50730 RepID=A0A6A5QV04_AMPQU|nr:hypothetical protein BDU57DRAFT_528795 [Ampelomyces quisqualis]
MSFKAKDLHFDNEQPAFLRRLRGELTSGDTARHEQPIQRNKRLKNDDEDDAPTYVLEETKESLTREEYEALVSGKDSKDAAKLDTGSTSEKAQNELQVKPKDKIAEVGTGTKKRKAAKIVNEEDEGGSTNTTKNTILTGVKATKKPKKKAKAVKLTFGDEEA